MRELRIDGKRLRVEPIHRPWTKQVRRVTLTGGVYESVPLGSVVKWEGRWYAFAAVECPDNEDDCGAWRTLTLACKALLDRHEGGSDV